MIFGKWYDAKDNLKDAYEIRTKVFVEEQNISKNIEFDNKDKFSNHLVVYKDNMPVATGRLLIENNKYVLGRIAVLKEERGNKYGDLILRMLIRKAFDLGADIIELHSQLSAVEFYKKLGFKIVGKPYEEASILHVNMIKDSDDIDRCK